MAEEIRIQPWFHPEYYSYFLTGLLRLYPRHRVQFTTSGFPPLTTNWYRPKDTFAFEVDGRRLTISANDYSSTWLQHVQWSHAHGQVNLDRESSRLPGVVPLGPYFSVRLPAEITGRRLMAEFLRHRPPAGWGPRQLIASARRAAGRASVDDLEAFRSRHRESGAPVFYLGTYWHRHPDANDTRTRFVRAARACGRFDGGLVRPPEDLTELAASPRPHLDYLARLAASPLALNADAVHGCLGWKLGEYLALGKAIVTTPVSNVLPAPLRHGEECHVVEDDFQAMETAIRMLLRDDEYRKHLGEGARRYYEQWLRPEAMVSRLLLEESRGST